jgi:hypothetical protein
LNKVTESAKKMSKENDLTRRLDTLNSHLEVLCNLIALDVVKDKKMENEKIGMLLSSGLKQTVIADLLWTKPNIVSAVKSNLETARKKKRTKGKGKGKRKARSKPAVAKGAEQPATTTQPSAPSDIK